MNYFTQCTIVTLILTLPMGSRAQLWIARYNSADNLDDNAVAIVVDGASNVYVTGGSRSIDNSVAYATIKYDPLGVEQWVARYDSPGNYGSPYAMAIDSLSNIYVTGFSYPNSGDADYATVKYDSLGVEQWVARYNGPGSEGDFANAVIVDYGRNIYVTGRSSGAGSDYDYATVKYHMSGTEKWVARYNGPGNGYDWASAIAIDNAGRIYVTGGSRGMNTGYDYATVKYDSLGVEQWVARYNGSGNGNDHAYAIAVDNECNIYVTGASYGSETSIDYTTVKYDSSGIEQWVRSYNCCWDEAWAICVDSASNAYVTGRCRDTTGDYNYATVKYNTLGAEQWVVQYDGPAHAWDFAHAIALDNSANIYVTGRSTGMGTSMDYATVKYDSAGVEQWVARYNGPGNSGDAAAGIAIDFEDNVHVTGYSRGVDINTDFCTIKYSPLGVVENTLSEVTKNEVRTTIFRGPLQLPEGKQCRVFDITGRVVEPDKIQPGIYFIEVEGIVTQKVVKVR